MKKAVCNGSLLWNFETKTSWICCTGGGDAPQRKFEKNTILVHFNQWRSHVGGTCPLREYVPPVYPHMKLRKTLICTDTVQ